jgi:hypothetical protein
MPKLLLVCAVFGLAAGTAQAAGVAQGAPDPAAGAKSAAPNVATMQSTPGTSPRHSAGSAEQPFDPKNPWNISKWKFHAGPAQFAPSEAGGS